MVGGTFLYVKILLSGLLDESELNTELRIKIEKIKENRGLSYLYRILKKVDQESADKITPNDYIRIQRALEVFFNTGLRMSDLQKKHAFKNDNYQICKIGLQMERKDLHIRINERVNKMVDNGFIEEVNGLKNKGYNTNIKAMKSIGYKELNSFLTGNIEKDEAIELIKQNTRRYAKRQMTWLRKEKEINWYNSSEDIELIEDKFNNFFSN